MFTGKICYKSSFFFKKINEEIYKSVLELRIQFNNAYFRIFYYGTNFSLGNNPLLCCPLLLT